VQLLHGLVSGRVNEMLLCCCWQHMAYNAGLFLCWNASVKYVPVQLQYASCLQMHNEQPALQHHSHARQQSNTGEPCPTWGSRDPRSAGAQCSCRFRFHPQSPLLLPLPLQS
jgi:hypothetical protein